MGGGYADGGDSDEEVDFTPLYPGHSPLAPNGHYRRVIHITAWHSPNVKRGQLMEELGLEPDGRQIIPGVKSYGKLLRDLATMDPIQQTVSLKAQFYEGAEVRMFPAAWLDRAHLAARALVGRPRQARAIGIDPAEGGDRTAMAAIDEWGLIELVSCKTPDTNQVALNALAFMTKHGVAPHRVCFDRGGGGKEHADRLRAMNLPVRTVGFGETVHPEPKRGVRTFDQRKDDVEEAAAYKNRRVEMYATLRQMLDPSLVGAADTVQALRKLVGTSAKNAEWRYPGFALPDASAGPAYAELRRQLEPIPLMYDGEGRLIMLPKSRPTGQRASDQKTLSEILGCSPDESDALVIAVYAMCNEARRNVAGAVGG